MVSLRPQSYGYPETSVLWLALDLSFMVSLRPQSYGYPETSVIWLA